MSRGILEAPQHSGRDVWLLHRGSASQVSLAVLVVIVVAVVAAAAAVEEIGKKTKGWKKRSELKGEDKNLPRKTKHETKQMKRNREITGKVKKLAQLCNAQDERIRRQIFENICGTRTTYRDERGAVFQKVIAHFCTGISSNTNGEA